MKLISTREVITEEEFHETALLLTEALKSGKTYQGVITAQEASDGSYITLSRYEDMAWAFDPKGFSNGVAEAMRRVDFSGLPSELVEATKLFLATRIADNKANSTVVSNFRTLKCFLTYLHARDINSTTKITPLVAMQFVDHCKSIKPAKGRKGQLKLLSKGTIRNRLEAVEMLHKALQGTSLSFDYPWPESSAGILAGIKQSAAIAPKTNVIPDDVFNTIFQYAHKYLERSKEILMLSAAVEKSKIESADMTGHQQQKLVTNTLKKHGYTENISQLKQDMSFLRTSCWIIILATTGIRISELLELKADSYYRKVEDDETYYFIKSKSIKTGEGDTSWLCPKVAIDALKVITQISEPLRDAAKNLAHEAKLRGDKKKAHELGRIQESCMLISHISPQRDNTIGIISDTRVNSRLREFSEAAGVDWHFTSHQFRRTFAHYVVHNQLGDLRYLRDHFKHWSLDMTALYAFDDDLDLELFNEIKFSYKEKRQGLFGHWMTPSTPLAGGLKNNLIALRSGNEAVKTYDNTEEMISTISNDIMVRSTGIAWCTNDAFGCASGKCDDCCHSIIDDSHQHHWKAMYAQQVELRAIASQVGPGGSATIERTIKRCEAVLAELGADIDAIKLEVAKHA